MAKTKDSSNTSTADADLRTLVESEMIKKDPNRMAAIKALAKRKLRHLGSFSRKHVAAAET